MHKNARAGPTATANPRRTALRVGGNSGAGECWHDIALRHAIARAGQTILACPDPPAQYAKDINTETQVAIGALGRLKASELANKTQVVTKPLLDNVPNSTGST